MNNFGKLLVGVFLISTLEGCWGAVYNESLNNGYYLIAIDAREEMSLGFQDGEYGIGVIGASIFAVAQDENFIYVQQHPAEFPSQPNKTIVNYFIIPLKYKIAKSPDKNFYGPLSYDAFNQKLKELRIEKLKYQYFFKDLNEPLTKHVLCSGKERWMNCARKEI